MKGCINEKKIPVLSFPTDKEFWKGFADYVRENIRMDRLQGFLYKPAFRSFVLKGEDGIRYDACARERGGFEVDITLEGTELNAQAILIPSDDGAFIRIHRLNGAPKCRRLRRVLEDRALRDIYLMFHTHETLPGMLDDNGGEHA